MIISVGEAKARCRGCGDADFVPAQAGPLTLAAVLVCSGCGERSTYEALLDSIGEEAMKTANESLKALLKQRRREKPKR